MTRARRAKAEPQAVPASAGVKVRLLCTLSGNDMRFAGAVIEVDEAEAQRLVEIGAAETVKA